MGASTAAGAKMREAVLMQRKYVEMRNGGHYVAGSRVSLASIIYEYRDGAAQPASAEIQQRIEDARKRLLAKQA